MSAFPPKADIGTQPRNVRFVPKADVIGRSRLASKPTSGIEDGLCFSFLYRRQRAEPRLGGARPVLVNRDHLIALADGADAEAYHFGTLSNEP
jgi:hypothetical protein